MSASRATAIVIPAGPADDVVDTVQSVLHYIGRPRTIIVIDDSRGGIDSDGLARLSSDVRILDAPSGAPGVHGGLWVKLASGYRYALSNVDFDVLLRLDADALVIGRGIEDLARERFETAPGTGMLGSYRYDTTGGVRDWSPAARILGAECGLRGTRQPQLRRLLRQLRDRAARNGYVPGEHPLGGAYLHSVAAVRSLADNGWLDLPLLAASRLGEDHIFSLLTVAAGFAIGDFGGPDDPLALRWKGLPDSPSALLERGKLVTHSVRYYEGLDERDIRTAFATRRQASP